MAAATFPLLAMLLCAAISSSLAAHFRQEKYNGYQNIYSLSTANHVVLTKFGSHCGLHTFMDVQYFCFSCSTSATCSRRLRRRPRCAPTSALRTTGAAHSISRCRTWTAEGAIWCPTRRAQAPSMWRHTRELVNTRVVVNPFVCLVCEFPNLGPGHVFYQKEVVTDTEMNIAPELWAPYVSP